MSEVLIGKVSFKTEELSSSEPTVITLKLDKKHLLKMLDDKDVQQKILKIISSCKAVERISS